MKSAASYLQASNLASYSIPNRVNST